MVKVVVGGGRNDDWQLWLTLVKVVVRAVVRGSRIGNKKMNGLVIDVNQADG